MISPLIRGNTRLVALLGNPVAHSLSPLIHNHIFAVSKLPYAYIPLAVPATALAIVVIALRQCGFLGANVTIPHKQNVLSCCDQISELSTLTGTVNTLFFKNNLLHGDTTDAAGFFGALKACGHEISSGPVALIGNGGTARTLAFALAFYKACPALTIIGRNSEKISALAQEIGAKTTRMPGVCALEDKALQQTLDQCTLIVNCTSAGMHPHLDASPLPPSLRLHPQQTVFDTIYNPLQSKLLRTAAAAGCKTENGLRMLLLQGLASFKLWTGLDIAESVIDLQELGNHVNS